jgi:hypothetical protein
MPNNLLVVGVCVVVRFVNNAALVRCTVKLVWCIASTPLL